MICQKVLHSRNSSLDVVKHKVIPTRPRKPLCVYIDVIAHTVHTLAKKFTCWNFGLFKSSYVYFHSQPDVEAHLDIAENMHI